MKKRRMNSIQENYIVSKAMWQAVHEVQAEKYNEFLSMKGLTDDDIDDDNFDALNAEYEVFAKAEIENSAMAWDNYRTAEQGLSEFGILFTVAKCDITKEQLTMVVNSYYNKRKEFIDIILHIDASTLLEALRVAV